MNKYTFVRSSIFEERFTVEAASEQEALEMVQDGDPRVEQVGPAEWVDWHDDNFDLESVEDDVVQFIKSKELA